MSECEARGSLLRFTGAREKHASCPAIRDLFKHPFQEIIFCIKRRGLDMALKWR